MFKFPNQNWMYWGNEVSLRDTLCNIWCSWVKENVFVFHNLIKIVLTVQCMSVHSLGQENNKFPSTSPKTFRLDSTFFQEHFFQSGSIVHMTKKLSARNNWPGTDKSFGSAGSNKVGRANRSQELVRLILVIFLCSSNISAL